MPNPKQDDLFRDYNACVDPEQKQELEAGLIHAMEQHARAIVFTILHGAYPDVVAQAVWKGLQEIPNFRGESKWSTFFHTIVARECGQYLRSEFGRGENRRTSEDLGNVELETSNFESELFPKLELDAVLDLLGDDERELALAKLEGCGEAELSERFGLTREGVRSRWLRIRRKLQESSQQSDTL